MEFNQPELLIQTGCVGWSCRFLCLCASHFFLFSHSINKLLLSSLFLEWIFRTKRNLKTGFWTHVNLLWRHTAKSIKFLFVFQLKFSAENEVMSQIEMMIWLLSLSSTLFYVSRNKNNFTGNWRIVEAKDRRKLMIRYKNRIKINVIMCKNTPIHV